MSRAIQVAAAAVAVFFDASAALSAVTINIVESNGTVIMSESGSLDLTGSTNLGSSSIVQAGVFQTRSATIYLGFTSLYNLYGGLTGGSRSFGNLNVSANAISFSGDFFGLLGSVKRFALSSSYVSGAALSGSSTFSGSIASLGLTEGTFNYSTPSDTITLNVGSAAVAGGAASVPEPATWAMMLMGFGAIGFTLRKRSPGLSFI
ncbi:hypothetical protein FHS31_000346 [Sphingomonas vulcanisoli]|uniref:Ice-binding protein C-terminal domain-containing protein n=1 Tax=Sphingomonas vulcanisoli TaxID=1658060 RepID=A0ABX0TPS5_9SPHN|nr:PEPxxWA-CTERM sorting domain-containing protein [Sphingomonas vulcanisoli]NIJ06764.1 hypothetical protein [Sphingomonas vulcanisoli]